MANAKREFEALDEFSTVAKKLVTKYPDLFYGLDIDEVRCVAVTNKERPENSDKLWEVMAVKQPIRLDCPYGWYLIVHLSDWESLGDKQKNILVAEMLCSIPVGDDVEGKLNQPDYKGYSVMLRTLGVDYLENPDTPDILAKDIQWIR